ncbi:hypothetical protein ACJX0J_023617, partial [Zea mays]
KVEQRQPQGSISNYKKVVKCGGHVFITHISLPEASDYLKELDAGGWLQINKRT